MPVGSSFITEVQTMETASKHVTNVADAIEQELRSLDGKIQPVTGSWSGAGSAAYLALHQRWVEETRKLRTVLGEISQGLHQNAVRYQTNEDEVVAQMNRAAAQF